MSSFALHGVAVAALVATWHPGIWPSSRVRAAHAIASPDAALAELWVEPEPDRDLFYGVGGLRLRPDASWTFTVVKIKAGGFSEGYTVRDPRGGEWSAKLYPEARTEVVASRVLWGVGYHQPPIYALEEWQAEGARSENPQPVARFREERPDFHGLTESGPWSVLGQPVRGHQAAGRAARAAGDAGQFRPEAGQQHGLHAGRARQRRAPLVRGA